MNYPIKPPLYALDRDQTHDLVYCAKLHRNIKAWLYNINLFPIVADNSNHWDSGLLLFDRYTPYLYPWCDGYSQKIYDFYSFIGNSYYYDKPWFNGYGISGLNYGKMLTDEDDYDFNIPEYITINNQSDDWVTIGYLTKAYEETELYFLHIIPSIEIYSKRFIYIPPHRTYIFQTNQVLFCSMVLSSQGDITGKVTGIPDELLYDKFEEVIEPIKQIITNNYPYLNQCLSRIDYELKAASWYTTETILNRAYSSRNYYNIDFVPGTIELQPVPDWYHYSSLIHANNNKWHDSIIPPNDLGKDIILTIEQDYLNFFTWSIEYDEILINSDVEIIPLLGVTERKLNDSPSELLFTYRGYSGLHYPVRSPKNGNSNYRILDWYPYDLGSAYLPSFHLSYEDTSNFFELGSQTTVSYTNQNWINEIDDNLFSDYNGFCYALISPFIHAETLPESSISCQVFQAARHESFVRYFFYDCNLDLESNSFKINLLDSGSFEVDICNDSIIVAENGAKFYQETSYNQGGFDNESEIMALYPSHYRDNAPNFFVSRKQSYSFVTALLNNPKDSTEIFTKLELIEFINTIIDEDFEDNEFMPDSILIKEIHAALQADKYSKDDENPDLLRHQNIGKMVEQIGLALGLNFKSNGQIRSARQTRWYAQGSVLPAGWPIGQWGTNQGGSDVGQVGGEMGEERLGMSYQVRSGRFEFDPRSGEPTKIEQGGYVLVENIPQLLHIIMNDFDKALGMQELGAFTLPSADKSDFMTAEGLASVIAETLYSISAMSISTSQGHVSSLKTQAITQQILKGLGLPCDVQQFPIDPGVGKQMMCPYPGVKPEAPTLSDLLFLVLRNLGFNVASLAYFKYEEPSE